MQVSSSLSDLLTTAGIFEQPCERSRAVPETAFTPTATVLHRGTGPESVVPANMQSIIAEAIRQGIAARMQQSRQASSVVSGFCMDPGQCQDSQFQGDFSPFPEPYSPVPKEPVSTLRRKGKENWTFPMMTGCCLYGALPSCPV